MRTLVLALAFLAIVSCGPASQEDPAVYGTLSVHVPPADWDTDHRAWARLAASELSLMGPAVVLVDTEADADVIVRHLGDNLPSCAGAPGGQFVFGANEVWVDPVCGAQGELGFRSMVGHEIAHLWLDTRYHFRGHVCQNAGDASDCHESVFGVALTNPSTTRGTDPGATTREVWVGLIPAWYPLEPDLALVRRLAGR